MLKTWLEQKCNVFIRRHSKKLATILSCPNDKKRNQIIVYPFQKIAFRFRIDLTDKRTTFLLCSWIIVKLSCVSYRVWKSLLNYRDVFCVDGYVVIFAMRFGQLSIRGFPYFLSFCVCSSVVGTVYPSRRWFLAIESLVSSSAATEEPSCQI